MDFVNAILRVLAVGLILGAGLPALFGVGMRLVGAGSAGPRPDGTVAPGNPALRYLGYFLYAFVAAVIIVSILWIARQTVLYYFDIKIFPAFAYK
ncbi:hypothetical protein GOHSU_08_01250 [Gordonia hirsuta DSM 44140 = NBRC 16056]|uniref:Uncharacterized protein n=1 Tax=Gordonia hirsuta DSM 44140 = NBRC 16056 TaxID=1121927 RepID=L7L976_9ACTN|nr:hypothetical protein [Gordonia hirsuta]GAC56597.1 hypothetical protein GOHSU_08_01250 [Gordonia hirsuta DSM 44140 = NBRC 16056]